MPEELPYGALRLPVYDTTVLPLERGIHVHARPEADAAKEIDDSFAAVRIVGSSVPEGGILISEADAVHFMTSSVFGVEMSHILMRALRPPASRCRLVQHPCPQPPPVQRVRAILQRSARLGREPHLRSAGGLRREGSAAQECAGKARHQAIRLSGGIQIWGSSPALLWTSPTAESKGIHVHAFKTKTGPPAIDETYSAVVIDGVKLDPQQVRVLMAQRTLLSLRNRVAAIHCPDCAAPVFEDGLLAFTPQVTHTCAKCGARFTAKGRLRKTIGNPLLGILPLLAKSAPRATQHHELTL